MSSSNIKILTSDEVEIHNFDENVQPPLGFEPWPPVLYAVNQLGYGH